MFFNIPDISDGNYILHKLILFVSLFVFSFVTQIISGMKSKCPLNQFGLMNNSIHISTIGIIGYSLFIDLVNMETTHEYMSSLITSKYVMFLIASVIIVLLISVVKIVNMLFENPSDKDRCDKDFDVKAK